MSNTLMTAERIHDLIHLVRGQRVMLDSDLAALYGVTTSNLNKAVGRNAERFPPDFMFCLTPEETSSLMFQIGTSKTGRGGRRKPVNAFTEEGVAMLSGVLRSPQAVQVNIEIMRAFVHLREMLAAHKDLARRLEELEAKYDNRFRAVFAAIRQLMKPSPSPAKNIGFHVKEKPALCLSKTPSATWDLDETSHLSIISSDADPDHPTYWRSRSCPFSPSPSAYSAFA